VCSSDLITAPQFVPLVRARMSTINDESVKEREYPHEDGEWMANREQNLTWATELSSTNEIVDGEWWPADYQGAPLVSVEEEAAMEMGVALGDRLKFRVAGQEIELTIASTRKINWDSFQPNFFMVLSPGALDGYPATFVASLKIQEQDEGVLLDLVRSHPTVSVIDIDVILQQVISIIEKASLAVQAVVIGDHAVRELSQLHARRALSDQRPEQLKDHDHNDHHPEHARHHRKEDREQDADARVGARDLRHLLDIVFSKTTFHRNLRSI
jgi:putative ABC transport system permease protein